MTIQWTDELQAVARECVAKGVSQTVTADILGVSITALLRFTDHAGLVWASRRGPYVPPADIAARNAIMVAQRQKGATLSSLASTYGISIESVRRALRKSGVMGQRQKVWSEADFLRVLDLRDRGLSFDQVAADFGISRNAVANAATRARRMRTAQLGRVPLSRASSSAEVRP